MQLEPVLIGIAGGTGSGKTTLASRLASLLRPDVALISFDAYYKDLSHLPFAERAKANYDHPLAFDIDLILEHLRMLKNGQAIERPTYNYRLHVRDTHVEYIAPKNAIIVEGILIFENQALRDMFDIKVFVDTDADVRLLRRILRDIEERGRDIASVAAQYLATVKPMHDQFVEPSKRYADLIIPEGGFNTVALDVLAAKVRAIVEGRRHETEELTHPKPAP